jgi:hypothetical protein
VALYGMEKLPGFCWAVQALPKAQISLVLRREGRYLRPPPSMNTILY